VVGAGRGGDLSFEEETKRLTEAVNRFKFDERQRPAPKLAKPAAKPVTKANSRAAGASTQARDPRPHAR